MYKKSGRLFFMRAKHIIGHFDKFFSRGQKSRGPLEKPKEMADLVFCQQTKYNITNF